MFVRETSSLERMVHIKTLASDNDCNLNNTSYFSPDKINNDPALSSL